MEKNRTNEPHSSEPGTRTWEPPISAVLQLPHFQTVPETLFATKSVVATHPFSSEESRVAKARCQVKTKHAERVICDVIL